MTEYQTQQYANTVPNVEKEVKVLNQYLADINRAFAYLQTEGKSDERKMYDLDNVVCQIKNLGEHMTRYATAFDVWRRRLDVDAI